MAQKCIKNIAAFKPMRMWVDGECFNLTKTDNIFASNELTSDVIEANVEQEPNLSVSEDGNGHFSKSLTLPAIYYIKLNQKQNIDIKALSQETKTQISLPKWGENGKLIITGDKGNLLRALSEILFVTGQIRNQCRPMQFLAVPLMSDEIGNNFLGFKSDILSQKDTIRGMEESIFQKPSKLHLTIDVLVLQDNNEKQEAIVALEEYRNTILRPILQKSGPLNIQVEGIDCMNDDYNKVDVLYAKTKFIQENESLQNIANGLSNFFYEKGLLKKHQENVKLHMTLINTKYRNKDDSPKKWCKRQSFNATKIMEKYKDFKFGTSNFTNIRLVLIGSQGEDGFYKTLSEINV